MTKSLRRTLALAALALALPVLALPAFGDIKAYNEAVKRLDYKAATAAAADTWPTLDKKSEDIADIAREFGFSAYVAGDFEAAKMYATFLAENGAGLPKPDGAPLTSKVLLRVAEFRLTPSKAARDALYQALTERLGGGPLDNITYLSADYLIGADTTSKAWAVAKGDAELASKLAMIGGGPGSLEKKREFDVMAAALNFQEHQNKDAYIAMVELHNSIVHDINAAPNQNAVFALTPHLFRSQAWADAIKANLSSEKQQVYSRVDDAETYVKMEQPNRPVFRREGPASAKPPCQGRLMLTRTLRYPSAAGFAEQVGAVVMRVKLDAQGKPSNGEILAAVPSDVFGKTVLDALSDMRFAAAKGVDMSACSLQQESLVTTFTFRIP